MRAGCVRPLGMNNQRHHAFQRSFYFEGHVRCVALPIIQFHDALIGQSNQDCYSAVQERVVCAALSFGNLSLAVDEDLLDRNDAYDRALVQR